MEFKGKRSVAWKYNLLKDNQPVQVCQEFFLCTYGLTRAKLETIGKHMNDQGNPTPPLAHKPATTISSTMIEIFKQHIESVESHYCRASTQRQYLDLSLSVPKMHSLYVESMAVKDHPSVKLWKYNEIFTTHYNLGFHKAKGDLCDKCTVYENTPVSLRTLTR